MLHAVFYGKNGVNLNHIFLQIHCKTLARCFTVKWLSYKVNYSVCS